MKTGRKAGFAALTTLICFLGAEAGLRLVASLSAQDWRVDPLPAHQDYQVLCDFGDLLRLCPDRGPAYERVRPIVFARDKDRPRVVTIGESFVYGLGLPAQDAWPARLQATLHDQAEVLNLGRCGTYASRLVPLVQAAITLDADVVVLSVGNNEHTMTSFYSGWAGRHPLAVYKTSQTLGRLQLFGLLSRVIGIPPRAEESFEEQPREFGAELDRQVYAARRRPPDLRAFDRSDLPEGVHLAGPRVTTILEDEQRLKEEIFRGQLDAMLQLLQDADVDVILTTLPRDLTVPPVLSGVHQTTPAATEEAIVAAIQAVEGGSSPSDSARQAALASALSLDPRVSFFEYKQGLGLLHSGQQQAAGEALRLAVEWDLVPDATPSINAITADMALSRGLPLVDLDHSADPWLDNPEGFFLDKVHVNAQGAEIVAQALAPAVQQALDR